MCHDDELMFHCASSSGGTSDLFLGVHACALVSVRARTRRFRASTTSGPLAGKDPCEAARPLNPNPPSLWWRTAILESLNDCINERFILAHTGFHLLALVLGLAILVDSLECSGDDLRGLL